MTRKRSRSSANAPNAITGSRLLRISACNRRASIRENSFKFLPDDRRARSRETARSSYADPAAAAAETAACAHARARDRDSPRREALPLSCWNSWRSTSSSRYREKRRLVANRYEPTESQITRQTTSLSLPLALHESVSLEINTAATTIDSVSPELPEWFRYTRTRTRK